MDDFYAANAEWFGALVAPMQPPVNAALGALLPHPVPTGVAVDLGSGIGMALSALRAAGADRLYAIEPSGHLRVGLMTHVALDTDLAPRTTILPGTLDGCADRLPDRWGAVLALNVLGHLDPAALDRFFDLLGEHLADGGRLVVGLQPPLAPTPIEWTEFGETRVGEHRFVTRGRAAPEKDGVMAWEMEWTLRDATGEVLDRRTQVSHWRLLTPERLTERCAAIGLTPAGSAPDLLMYAYAR